MVAGSVPRGTAGPRAAPGRRPPRRLTAVDSVHGSTNTRTGTLDVPGATLYYEVTGTGPLLLISQSGDADTRRGGDLTERLAEDHTVVT
jgi:myo-inositol-hexaphosphate 3-phosphohydrolase